MKRVLDWFAGRPRTPLDTARWVVLDCETSGLKVKHDRLLAVGAVAVQRGRIDLANAYAAVVRQAEPSDARNILIHGIGGDAQRAGRAQDEVLRELEAFIGESVAVAFHAPFDAAMLHRKIPLDLARLAPALDPERARGSRTLDDWLLAYGIEAHARHDALGDAFATAQLFLVLLARAARQRIVSVESLLRAARASGWLYPRFP